MPPSLSIPDDALRLYNSLKPVLGVVGLDPVQIGNKLTKGNVDKILSGEVAAVTAKLSQDRITPANMGDDPKSETRIIKATTYQLLKMGFKRLLPSQLDWAAGYVADEIRDDHLDNIVARVAPRIDRNTPMSTVVNMVKTELVESLF
jgi:hypothetical protein